MTTYVDRNFPHKLALFMYELRRLKTIDLDDKQRKFINIAYQQIAEEKLKKSWNDELLKIVEFEKPEQQDYYNMFISCPVLSDWYTDTDYQKYVVKAQRNLNKLRNGVFKYSTKDIPDIKLAIKDMHPKLNGDWKMSAIAHTQSMVKCSLNVCTLRFQENLTIAEEIERMKEDIEKKKNEMKEIIKKSIALARKKGTGIDLEKTRLDDKKMNLSKYIKRTKSRIEYNEELQKKGKKKSTQEMGDKILISVGFLEDQIILLNEIRQSGYLPNGLDDIYYSSFHPSIMPFNWQEMVFRAGYLPWIKIPRQTKEYGDTMGLMTIRGDPIVKILKLGKESYAYYTARIKIPLEDVDPKNFRRHEADIRERSADEKGEALIKSIEEESRKKQPTEKPEITTKKTNCKPPPKKEIKEIENKQDVKCNNEECSPIQQYLIKNENNNQYKIKIWSAIIKFLQEMEKKNIKHFHGIYGGGFATYLYTKGAYDTTDIDYKIYPKDGVNIDLEKERVENYINSNKNKLLKSINGEGNDYKEILTKWSTGFKETDQNKREGVFKITLVGPGYGSDGKFYGETRVAYCDIGFWSESDFVNDALQEKGIVPPVDETFYSEYKIRVIRKDFLIKEKELFLKNLTNETMKHKQANWEKQVRMLKMIESLKGGRKTRRKRRKKKKRTKKKKKRGKKKKGSGIGCSKPIRVTPINLPLNVVPGVVVHEVTVNAPTASELRMAVPYDDGERDVGMIRLRQGLNNNNSTRPIPPLRQVLEYQIENNRRNQEQRRLQQLQERINRAWEGGKRKKKRKKKTKKRKRRKRRKKTRRR